VFYVYILKSKSTGRFYVGHGQDVFRRVEEHNSGKTPSTKRGRPWELVYYEQYQSRGEAMKREYGIKKKKSRKYINRLINNCSEERTEF